MDNAENLQPIVDKVQKLLNLSAKAGTEAEAAAAMQKAQDLLTAYNLDMALVEKNSTKPGQAKREDIKFRGGMYKYQWHLWYYIAQLNFCLYFRTTEPETKVRKGRTIVRQSLRHRVVGRTINTRATLNMAEYLESTIERLCKDRYPHPGQFMSASAMSYRQGLADRVIDKILARRNQLLEEDRIRKEKERAAAGVSTSTALSLTVYVDEEHDANMDFLYGEGWSAQQASKRAQRAAAQKAAEEAYTKWAAENPELAKAEEEKRRKEASKRSRSRGGRSEKGPSDLSAYYSGYDKGEEIGIDPQTESRKVAGLLK